MHQRLRHHHHNQSLKPAQMRPLPMPKKSDSLFLLKGSIFLTASFHNVMSLGLFRENVFRCTRLAPGLHQAHSHRDRQEELQILSHHPHRAGR
jgi:hypothetical protein